MDLDPNSNTLTLTDTMGSALDLVTGSVVVKDIYGNVIPNDTLTYDPSTHTFTLTLNDQQAYIVTYSAAVNLVAGSTLDDTNATNTCALRGVVTSGEDGTVVIRSRVYDNSASSSSVIGAATLNIIKHDDDSTTEVLSGAQFSVQTAALSGSNVTSVSDFTSATTDASGRISINNIARGTCYMITETDAPSGYQLDDAPRFIIFSESSNSTYPSTVTYNGSTYSVEVISNTRASYDLYIANSEIVTGSNPQPTQPTETSAPTETTQPSETSTPTQTAAPSETTTTPSVDATAATTAATTATEPSVDASAATRPSTTTTTTTAPSETTAPAPSILGASRVQNEEADPTTASSEETTTTTAPAATPTAAPSGTSSTPSTGESGNATVLVGTIVIAAASLCFVFYVRKSKKEHN